MPRLDGCNDRQSNFLRAFIKNPSGPPAKDWPSPAILRRWLRRPRFRAAFDSIQSTLRLQEGFLLTSAASSALRALDVAQSSPDLIRHTLSLLRLSQLRRYTHSLLKFVHFLPTQCPDLPRFAPSAS